MTPDENTEDEELATQDLEDADEEVESPVDDETSEEAPAQKLSYEEKLANAADDTERFRIANAEAAKQRRLAAKARHAPAPVTPAIAEEQTQEQTEQTPPSTADVDERILLAQGMDPKLLVELKAIAQVRKKGLIEAQNDDLFVAAKDKFEKDKKRREAGLGGSRGSGSQRVAKTTATPNLSRDEHRRAAGYVR